MANIKISQLPTAATVLGTDVVPVVTEGTTSQLSVNNLAKALPQVTSSISASYATTASYVQNVVSASYAQSAVSASYVLSASFATTSSLPLRGLVTASAAGSTITFTKGDSSTFSVTVTGASADSASYVSSSNVDGPYGKNSVVSASFAVSASWAPATVVSVDTTIYSAILPITNFSTNNGIYLGTYAGQGASSANYSNFLGINAGLNATDAANSNFIGNNTGNGSVNAKESNFLGYYAGFSAAEAEYSNFIGHAAGSSASSASFSNLLGYYAGHSATNASHSILIGNQAGRRLSGAGIGPNNIIIGTNITLEEGRRDSINLGNIIYATGSYSDPTGGNQSSASMVDARVGINKSIPNYTLDVSGSGNYANSLTVTGSLTLQPSGSFILPGTASNNPVAGNFYFDFTVNKLYAYNGTQWVTASLGA